MKRTIRRFLPVAAIALVTTLTACEGGFYVDLAALNEDPVVAAPTVESFLVEREIHVEWPEDRATDTYVLYRDDVRDPVEPTIIYEGTDLSFVDRDVVVGRFYYYRLAKRRGQKLFEPSEAVLAVGSDVREDEWEPNDVRSQAATFEDGMLANIYAYRDVEGQRVVDVDYYKITVPGRSRARILATSFVGFKSGELMFALEQKPSVPLNDGDVPIVPNETFAPKTFVFRMLIDEPSFFGTGGSGFLGGGSSGGGVGSYNLQLISIESL